MKRGREELTVCNILGGGAAVVAQTPNPHSANAVAAAVAEDRVGDVAGRVAAVAAAAG